VDPRAGLDTVAKRKFFSPVGNRIPVFHPIAYSLYWLSCPGSRYKIVYM